MSNIISKSKDCKSFGKKESTFKKCKECKIVSACQELFKPAVIEEEVKPEVKPDAKTENKAPIVAAKIGKAQQVKDKIFSLARKAAFTRKELGEAVRKAFPEYKNSTISTYISDSFNIKYAGATGCGKHRMLSYTAAGGNKKIVTVR